MSTATELVQAGDQAVGPGVQGSATAASSATIVITRRPTATASAGVAGPRAELGRRAWSQLSGVRL